jgi:hypothetical protein
MAIVYLYPLWQATDDRNKGTQNSASKETKHG